MADCPICRAGRLVLQVETISRRPIQYHRCTECGIEQLTVEDRRANKHGA